MKGKRILVSMLALGLLVVLAAGLSLAQGLGPSNEAQWQGEVSVAAIVSSKISYQGVLKEGGGPVTGLRDMVFRLYTTSACSGIPVQSITENDVLVTNGLFSVDLDVNQAHFNGQGLWLAVDVEGTRIGCQEVLPAPYALSLRPGAVVSNTSASRHGLEVWSDATGSRGTALWAENSNTTSGIALWAVANGSDASLVSSNRGAGPLFKGFGGDGGEDEFRLNNNGSIESKADSYIFVPGNELVKNDSADTTRWVCATNGAARIWRGSAAGDKWIYFPITLPGVLYGQGVKVKSITVYYKCQDGTKNHIDITHCYKQTDADSSVGLVSDLTDRTSNTATSYTLMPTSNNVLSSDQGILSLHLRLHFVDDSNNIQIGGVRVQLGHHHLY